MTAPGDLLHRFLFERLPVRGHLVRLDASWRAAIEHQAYPEARRRRARRGDGRVGADGGRAQVRGPAVAAVRRPGPVRLMLAQCTHRHAIRGVARHDELPEGASAEGGLFGDGQLGGDDRAGGGRRALPGRRAAGDGAARRLPRAVLRALRAVAVAPHARGDGRTVRPGCCCSASRWASRAATERAEADDAWRRLGLLAATVSPKELFDLPSPRAAAAPVPRGRHPPVRGRAGLLPVHLLARARRRHPAVARRRRGQRAARPSAATWRCAANSATAPGASMRWTSPGCSRPTRRSRRRRDCTSRRPRPIPSGAPRRKSCRARRAARRTPRRSGAGSRTT